MESSIGHFHSQTTLVRPILSQSAIMLVASTQVANSAKAIAREFRFGLTAKARSNGTAAGAQISILTLIR